jgi:hypothetical protein
VQALRKQLAAQVAAASVSPFMRACTPVRCAPRPQQPLDCRGAVTKTPLPPANLTASSTPPSNRQGVKVSVNDCVVRAAALALRDVPGANAAWDAAAGAVVPQASVDVAIAVATEGGLITPIVRDAANKSLAQVRRGGGAGPAAPGQPPSPAPPAVALGTGRASHPRALPRGPPTHPHPSIHPSSPPSTPHPPAQISAEVRDLAARARANKLAPHEFQGGSFTISNLGMFGLAQFSAIINPPQAAILAVGGPHEDASLASGELEAATAMTATLSADHRVFDGQLAAEFLAAFRGYMAQPVTMVI